VPPFAGQTKGEDTFAIVIIVHLQAAFCAKSFPKESIKVMNLVIEIVNRVISWIATRSRQQNFDFMRHNNIAMTFPREVLTYLSARSE